jgi:putative ATP-dependent endonuclease of the OLD family
VAPLKSVVLLRAAPGGTQGHSLASLNLTALELEDLQRYVTTTRADLLFSRGVLLVEGDAEAALVPVFADSLGYNLDELGIALCNVAGVNFAPYVKLAAALGMPHAVITDWDPLDGTKPPLGRARAIGLSNARREATGREPLSADHYKTLDAYDEPQFRAAAAVGGIFLNSSTLELEVVRSDDLRDPLLAVLEAEGFGPTRTKRLADWKSGARPVDSEQLMAMIGEIGKGRLATRLAANAVGLPPPDYVRAAIEYVLKDV